MQIILATSLAIALYLGVELFRLVNLNNLISSAWGGLEVLANMRNKELKNLIQFLNQDKGIEKRIVSTLVETSNTAIYAYQASNPHAIGDAEAGLRTNLSEINNILENRFQAQTDDGAKEQLRQIIILTNNITNAINGYNKVSRNINDKLGKLPSSLLAPLVGCAYSQPITFKNTQRSGLFLALS
jgi:hypothetical protein